MLAPLIAALLGILLGVRHAFEPDHLAAVSTLAGDERSVKGGLFLGAVWGLGHSIALLGVGGSLAAIETQMPVPLANAFELGVGMMIVGLGLRAIVRAVREGRRGRVQSHRHGPVLHTHSAAVSHVHVSRWTLATRPLLVGLVHGLAGSGALTALVLAELPTVGARLTYIALFGAGSMVGMAMLSALCGVPLAKLQRAPRLMAACLLGIGVLSVCTGAWWTLGAAERLFG